MEKEVLRVVERENERSVLHDTPVSCIIYRLHYPNLN